MIGVFISSCLTKSGKPVRGVFAERAESSEGKVEETGVCSCASLGLVVEPEPIAKLQIETRAGENQEVEGEHTTAGKLATTEESVGEEDQW